MKSTLRVGGVFGKNEILSDVGGLGFSEFSGSPIFSFLILKKIGFGL